MIAAVHARRTEIETKLRSSATSFTLPTLEDFDWSLRVISQDSHYIYEHICLILTLYLLICDFNILYCFECVCESVKIYILL